MKLLSEMLDEARMRLAAIQTLDHRAGAKVEAFAAAEVEAFAATVVEAFAAAVAKPLSDARRADLRAAIELGADLGDVRALAAADYVARGRGSPPLPAGAWEVSYVAVGSQTWTVVRRA